MDIHGHPRYECSSCAHCVLIMTIHAILRQRLLNLHAFQIMPPSMRCRLCVGTKISWNLLKSAEIMWSHCEAAWRCRGMYLLTAAEWEQFVLESVCSVQIAPNWRIKLTRNSEKSGKVLERNPIVIIVTIVQHFRLPKLLGLNLAKLLRMHSMPCHAFHHWLSFPTPPSCFKRRCKSSTCTASPQTSTNLLHLHHTISHDITCMTCLWPFYDAFICYMHLWPIYRMTLLQHCISLKKNVKKKRHGWCESFMITEP